MRKLACSGIFLLAALGSAHAADPLGEWRVEDGAATIKIVDCNNSLWGVVSSEIRPGIDKENPDKTKRNRPTLGIPVLLDMKKSDEKEKWDGNIYNAKNGKTYEASITLKTPNTLEVEGCVMSVLCGGQTWTRIAAPLTPPPGMAPKATSSIGTPRTGAPPVAPRTTVAKSGHPKAGETAEPAVSEVCLLPEVTRTPH